ncbi:MAG: S-layer homology domain-containing protein, partial [Clostridia bacterium]|nr:S-layer homology domain-containing protein [Clostridia bacterium]
MIKSKSTLRHLIALLVIAMIVSIVPVYAEPAAGNDEGVVTYSDESTVADKVIITAGKDDTSLHFTWLSQAEADEVLQWAEAADVTDSAFPAECHSVTASVTSHRDGKTARAEATALTSDTDYIYRIGNDTDGWSETYTFSTGDFEDNSFTFLLAGDPQIGDSGKTAELEDWYTTLNKSQEWFADDTEFLLVAGDMAQNTIIEEYNSFATHSWLRSLPLITTVGNHDDGRQYSEVFTYTDVDQRTLSDAGEMGGDYWVEYDGVLIMSLNMNNLSFATHRDFMLKAVDEYTSLHGEPVWTLLTFHQAMYSAAATMVEDTGDEREEYSAFFSKLGVDAVMMGHDHVYTRTYMMDGNTPINDPSRYVGVGADNYGSFFDPNDTSVLYITANAAGDKYYDLSDIEMPYMAFKNQEYIPNITKVEVTPDSLVFTTYRATADNEITDIVDRFAIHRTPEGNPENDLPVYEVLNSESADWKYLDDGSYPFELSGDRLVWTREDYDDSAWKDGKGAFGAINGELAEHEGITPNTLLSQYYPEGHDSEGENVPNFFFRTTFDIADPESVTALVGELRFDDSVLIYVNGVLLKDLHVGTVGNVGYSANERDGNAAFGYFRVWDKAHIESLGLKEKGNVLAVELFQCRPESDDIFFDFTSLSWVSSKPEEIFLPFEDVTEGSWYYESVAKAYHMGLFAGTTETLFSPKMTMTRAMTWTVLARVAGADITTDGKWYAGAQEWAMENGVSDGTNPHNEITREQFAVMLHALSGKPETEATLDSFTDKDEASSWAEIALCWAVENGILSGKGNGILDPKATAT